MMVAYISQEFANQAQQLLAKGVPVHGMGVQSHFRSSLPNPDTLMVNAEENATI